MKYHIEKNTVQETLVIPLFGRLVCSERFPELFSDPEAKRICDSLDYDFAEKRKKMEFGIRVFRLAADVSGMCTEACGRRRESMTAAEKILKKKTVYRAEMDKALPKAQSDALWQEATARLDGYLTEYSSLPKGFHMHTDSRILPAVAVYLTLKDVLGQEKAFSVIENAAVTGCAGIEKKLSGAMRLPGMKGLFVRFWDPMTKKLFGEGNGFRNVFYPKKKGEYRMDVISCPYFRYFTELGCPELTKIFCENDDRIYGNLPGLKFERTGTLGKGAERCDFLLRKD